MGGTRIDWSALRDGFCFVAGHASIESSRPLKQLKVHVSIFRCEFWNNPIFVKGRGSRVIAGYREDRPRRLRIRQQDAALRPVQRFLKDCISGTERSNEALPIPISGKTFSDIFMVRVPSEMNRMLPVEDAELGVRSHQLGI
jgi:hypothetical protein